MFRFIDEHREQWPVRRLCEALDVDAFDTKGRPVHARGVSKTPGLYFLGLAWLSRRASAFIWGVWHDAEYLAGHIAQRG